MDGAQRDSTGRRTVAALFQRRADVEQAVADLRAAGFDGDAVAVAWREDVGDGRADATTGAVVTVAAGDRVNEAFALLERSGAHTEPAAIGHRAEIAPRSPDEAVEDDALEPPGTAAAPAGGALAGAVAGATVGTVVAGPLGTVVGGVAGAAAGAVVGQAVREQSESLDDPNG
jgi:uncharacterized membrane protein